MQTQEDIEFKKKEEELEKALTTEAKLNLVIGYLKMALSEGERVSFRDFWKWKKICLELFKKELHPTTRSVYWDEYTKILSEAHYLQKMNEEQSSFRIEQITLALGAIENELKEKEEKVAAFDVQPLKIRILHEEFQDARREYSFLSNIKEKLTGLREEVLSQEIRIGQKNKLLGQISKAGDEVFPRRKQLIETFTKTFTAFIDEFIRNHFDLTKKTIVSRETPFHLKKSVKDAQDALKVLPVSNEAYRNVRALLSQCWDVLSVYEQQRKEELEKERAEEMIQNKEKEKALLEVRKKQDESKEKALKAIEIMQNLLKRGDDASLEELEGALTENLFKVEDIPLSRKEQFTYYNLVIGMRDLILSKKISMDVHSEELEEQVASHKEDLQKMIQEARKEMPRCGLDVAFAMQLKEIVEESRKYLSQYE